VPVYMIIEIEITDHATYSEYVEKVQAVVEAYGGRYLVRGGRATSLSGGWHPERIIVIEFESSDQMRTCFASTEYLELAPLRERSTASRAVVVDGYIPPERGPVGSARG
jgi:uncharacterized protein (DUF1330 family)